MDVNTVIKLKKNYLLFIDNEYLCIYNREKKVINFKLRIDNNTFDKKVEEELKRCHSIRWFSKQRYWNWLGILIMKYSFLFDVLVEEDCIKEIEEDNYLSVVKRENFSETFIPNSNFSNTTIVLYGMSHFNIRLLSQLKSYNFKSIVLIDRDEVVEVEDIGNKGGIFCFQDLGKNKSKILREKLNFNNLEIVSNRNINNLLNKENSIYLIGKSDIPKEELLIINKFIIDNSQVALFFNINKKNDFVFGPLVIGGESTCLECLKRNDILDKYYDDDFVCFESTFSYLAEFFIIRTLLYIKENNLIYLLKDSQLPLNKIFLINKDNLQAKMVYSYRNEECSCI